MKTEKRRLLNLPHWDHREPFKDTTNLHNQPRPKNLKVKKSKLPLPQAQNPSKTTSSFGKPAVSPKPQKEQSIPDSNALDHLQTSLTTENFTNNFTSSTTFGQMNALPIFKLLRVFKLQQYAKPMADLGYGHEVYKLLCLSETHKIKLLEKINLMPGHRAKFINFFDSIHQAYPQEERKCSLFRVQMDKDFEPDKTLQRGAKSNSMKPVKRRNNLIKKYKCLDAASKKSINDIFLSKVLNRPCIHPHLSEDAQSQFRGSKGFQQKSLIVSNDPASMYEKYGLSHNPKFVSKKNQKRKQRRRGTSHNNRMKLNTLTSDYNDDQNWKNETQNTLYEFKNTHNSRLPKQRSSKPRIQSKGRLYKRSDVTLKSNPLFENSGMVSTSAFPVKPFKKFTNPLQDRTMGTKFPQSVNSRHGKTSLSKLRKNNRKRNLSEDKCKRKPKNYSEERAKRKTKDFCIRNTRKPKNSCTQNKAYFDQASRDCAASTNATRPRVNGNQSQGAKNKKRAFSGNNRRVPLDAGTKMKNSKTNKEAYTKTSSSRMNHSREDNNHEINSEIGHKNGISFSEVQKESAKESSNVKSNISESKPKGMISSSSSPSKDNSYCSKLKGEYKLPRDEEGVCKIISKEIPVSIKQEGKNKHPKSDEHKQKGISLVKQKNPTEENKNLKIKSHKLKPEPIQESVKDITQEAVVVEKGKGIFEEKLTVPPSPLLTVDERLEAKKYGNSLDSKEINDSIGVMEIELLCKCLSHLILKHIEFSQGKVLVDDLVGDDQDIPLFSYDLGATLNINLEEIQQKIQMKEWEAESKNEENFQRLHMLMNGGNPYMFHDQQNPSEMEGVENPYSGNMDYERMNTHPISVEGLDQDPHQNPIDCSDINSVTNTTTNNQNITQNADIQIEHRANSQGCNLSIIQMGEMLQNKSNSIGSQGGISSYYSNLSMMGNSKPFFFPPPDLGMVESMGSYENSSRFFRSVRSSNMNKSFNKNTSICGLKNKKNITHEEIENESPITEPNYGKEEEKALEASARKTVEKSEEKDNISDASLKSIDSNFSCTDNFPMNSSEKANEPEESPEKHDMACGPTEPDEDLSHEENLLDLSTESYYLLEDLSREGLQKYLKDSMLNFNEKYSIKKKEIEQDIEVANPSFELCYKYCIYVMNACKMEKEIPLIAILYLERLLLRTGILMNRENWRRLILISMIISSKIWDDDSLENEHLPEVMNDATILEINTFERVFLDLIGYDLNVMGSEYAKYYFIFRTFAQKNNFKFPLENVKIHDVLKHHAEERITADLIKELSLKNVKLDQSI
ncbi:unnamed protein product [Moneuplotes crassus]|uniref:Cyclin N-terminal domain-containing protein n=1 Tax=Euplotes crassus TaxID=5936 RepID=A0AAD1UKK8_EUPCR|nr:unnamed protein product [Moneuplotes crassus]